MEFKQATINDLDSIINIINQAKQYLKNNNVDQWQNGYPNEETIINDINKNQLYVLINNDEIIATCMLSNEEDLTYNYIENGAWLTDNKKYLVIHRIAIKNNYQGKSIGRTIINYATDLFSDCKSIRIDTHENNLSMQRMLERNDFKYCGIIYLSDGSSRVAYEKLL